jgi:hypothetical protein
MTASSSNPRRCAAILAVVVGLLASPTVAHADEIVVLDLETCKRSTMRVAEIVSETWATVSYRLKREGRGPVEEIQTINVVAVRRGDGDRVEGARAALRQRNYREAISLAQSLCGGGWTTTVDENGIEKRVYNSFDKNDPSSGRKRPDWKSEYGHFLYAKALTKQGLAERKKDVVEAALLALDDLPVPGADAKQTSGGFLGRFKGGNSRFYGEAMALKAQALTFLGQYDEAKDVFVTLSQDAMRVPLAPQWAYVAATGGGHIAEAKGDLKAAVSEYSRAASSLLAILGTEKHRCHQLELGRFFARARALAIRVKLKEAERTNNKGLYVQLGKELAAETPAQLKTKYQSKPKAVLTAIMVGAQDPEVRAISSIGMGLADFHAGRFEDAVIAFREVTVVHFRRAEQVAQAYYYLGQAAEQAAKKANPKTKTMYESMAKEAKEALRTTFRQTEWANK